MGNKFDHTRWEEASRRLADRLAGRSSRRLAGVSGRMRAVFLGAGILAMIAAPAAMGVGEGEPIDGGVRNPSPSPAANYERETQIIANIAQTRQQTGGYATRQSNKSSTGGGAIYGCRAAFGGTPLNRAGCVRANNLADGFAFEFQATRGSLVGLIQAGANPFDVREDVAPFYTNAAGQVRNLNADKVDGTNVPRVFYAQDAGGEGATFETPIARLALSCSEGGDLGVSVASRVDGAFVTSAVVDSADSTFNAGTLASGETMNPVEGAESIGNGSVQVVAPDGRTLTVQHQYASDGGTTKFAGRDCLFSGTALHS